MRHNLHRQNQSGFSHIAIFLIIAVVGVTGFTAYKVMTAQQTSTSTVELSPDPDVTSQKIPAKPVLDKLAEAIIQQNLVAVTAADSGLSDQPGKAGLKLSNEGGVSWRPQDGIFSTSTDKVLSASVNLTGAQDSADTYNQIYKAWRASLTAQGLQKSNNPLFTNAVMEAYSNDMIFCQIDSFVEGLSNLSVACAAITNLTNAYAKATPLAKAYYAANPDPSQKLVITNVDLKKSQTVGYELADVDINTVGELGGAVGRLYKSPDNAWHFFVMTQTLTTCDQYKTAELKKAYKGTACYIVNQDKESTVQ